MRMRSTVRPASTVLPSWRAVPLSIARRRFATGSGRSAVLVAEAVPAQPRLRKRLRGQVARSPLEPAPTPRVDPQGVSLVQDPEGGRVVSRRPDQLRIRAVVRVDLHASL